MPTSAEFWDRVAEKYARDKIADLPAYEFTLERTRSYLRATDRVVELGAGTSSTGLLLAPSVATYLATDVSAEMVRIGREKLAEAPIAGMAIEQGSFDLPKLAGADYDAVLAFNLFHLVPDIRVALEQAAGMLRPGGLLISKTVCLGSRAWPVRGFFRAMIALMSVFGKAPKDVHFPTVAQMDAMVTEAGFEIVETGNYPAKTPSRYIVARKIG